MHTACRDACGSPIFEWVCTLLFMHNTVCCWGCPNGMMGVPGKEMGRDSWVQVGPQQASKQAGLPWGCVKLPCTRYAVAQLAIERHSVAPWTVPALAVMRRGICYVEGWHWVD